ncbi:MAG: hypothetical protein ABSF71_02210 [Terriglobia bacterium]|jgi:hypothetical protein
MTPGSVSGYMILAGAELCLLAAGAFSDTPQAQSYPHPSPPSTHARTLKRTWRTGPATTPPDTEVVPPHPSSVPPPIRGLTLSVEGEQKSGEAPGVRPSAGSTLATKRTSPAPIKPVPAKNDKPDSSYVDPEKRARDEMNCLSTNPKARQAFYDDLRRTVEQVRAGSKDVIEKNPAPCGQ